MQRHKDEQMEWLEFDLLSDIPKLKHALFLRHGGCSEGPYKSLNVDYYVGDEEAHVTENLRRIKNQLAKDDPHWQRLVSGRGCHQDKVALVDLHSPAEILSHDGLLSATPGISLMMIHADCQIALIYDPKNHAVGNIHAGWRGNVSDIYGKAVKEMQHKFGSHPSELLVGISPSLGPDEAEFIHYTSELPEHFWSFQVRPTYFDLWAIAEYQLQNAGVLPHHIEVARISTYSNSHDFFSYRRDKVTGRHAACITLL